MIDWEQAVLTVGNEVIEFINYTPDPPPEALRLEDL